MGRGEISKQAQVVQAVERSLRQVMSDVLQEATLEGCLRLWRDFAARTDLGKTRKPAVWAAAVAYTCDRLCLGEVSQTEVAEAFRVSPISVSQKYQKIAKSLDLVLFDPRYVPEEIRAATQQGLSFLPEGIPLTQAPRGGWYRHLPSEFSRRMRSWPGEEEGDLSRSAQDLVYAGWEALDERSGPGDPELAEHSFREALRLDPTLADAYNGLACVAEGQGDFQTAGDHYRQAYELARAVLGSESPQAFTWWGDLETRPYMRARHGLAWVYWHTGRLRDAIAERAPSQELLQRVVGEM